MPVTGLGALNVNPRQQKHEAATSPSRFFLSTWEVLATTTGVFTTRLPVSLDLIC